MNAPFKPEHGVLMDCGDVLDDVERAIGRLVNMSSSTAGKAALADQSTNIIWQRCRLGNVLEQIGVPLRNAS